MYRYYDRLSKLPKTLMKPPGHWRLGIATLAIACLAGCAHNSQSYGESPEITDLESYRSNWTIVDADDPIGMLIINQIMQNARLVAGRGGRGHDNVLLAGQALNYLGIPYRFGGSTPGSGFDCSGLITYAAAQSLGVKLPRNAAEMADVGRSVDRSSLRIGDLVFFNTTGRSYSHVGIYLGDERFVHAPSSGGVVRIENLQAAYWSKRYEGARRLDSALLASAHGSAQR
jgi:hypothetical protein